MIIAAFFIFLGFYVNALDLLSAITFTGILTKITPSGALFR
jgi:hypothetical protein